MSICKAQPPLSSIVKTRRLSLFGHIARMNESTDASRILFEPPSVVWRKPRGRSRNSWVRTVTNDLVNSYTGLPVAREAAQDRVYWRMFTKHSAMHSLWCMLILVGYIGGPVAPADWLGPKVSGHLAQFLYSSCESRNGSAMMTAL